MILRPYEVGKMQCINESKVKIWKPCFSALDLSDVLLQNQLPLGSLGDVDLVGLWLFPRAAYENDAAPCCKFWN